MLNAQARLLLWFAVCLPCLADKPTAQKGLPFNKIEYGQYEDRVSEATLSLLHELNTIDKVPDKETLLNSGPKVLVCEVQNTQPGESERYEFELSLLPFAGRILRGTPKGRTPPDLNDGTELVLSETVQGWRGEASKAGCTTNLSGSNSAITTAEAPLFAANCVTTPDALTHDYSKKLSKQDAQVQTYTTACLTENPMKANEFWMEIGLKTSVEFLDAHKRRQILAPSAHLEFLLLDKNQKTATCYTPPRLPIKGWTDSVLAQKNGNHSAVPTRCFDDLKKKDPFSLFTTRAVAICRLESATKISDEMLRIQTERERIKKELPEREAESERIRLELENRSKSK